jgi:hypothetical protein
MPLKVCMQSATIHVLPEWQDTTTVLVLAYMVKALVALQDTSMVMFRSTARSLSTSTLAAKQRAFLNPVECQFNAVISGQLVTTMIGLFTGRYQRTPSRDCLSASTQVFLSIASHSYAILFVE